MVVQYPHEPKTPRYLMNPEVEMSQKGALQTWNPQIVSNCQMGLIIIMDGKQILMTQLTFQLIYHQFRDLQEHQIPLLQFNLTQPDDKEHWEEKKMKAYKTFQTTPDLLQIYLQLFLLVLKIHLHLNQDLLPCPTTE
jgi:hypothetical protein